MEHRYTFQDLVDMARDTQAATDRRSADQGHLVSRPVRNSLAESPRPSAYDPALRAETIRSEAEAKYRLMQPIDTGADAVEQGFFRLSRINAILAEVPVDPAMIELKEEYQRGLLYRLQRFMRPGNGVVEDSLTIETTRRRQQY